MVDQLLLGEISSTLEWQESLEEYDRDWYIGLEKDPQWTTAVLNSTATLFSLGHNNTQVCVVVIVKMGTPVVGRRHPLNVTPTIFIQSSPNWVAMFIGIISWPTLITKQIIQVILSYCPFNHKIYLN